jgi:hypothetical protein
MVLLRHCRSAKFKSTTLQIDNILFLHNCGPINVYNEQCCPHQALLHFACCASSLKALLQCRIYSPTFQIDNIYDYITVAL